MTKKTVRVPKPPNSLIEIKNKDKSFTEHWNEKRAKDLANFPHSSRICLVGEPNSGKSFLCKHIFLHQRPRFKELYIIHADADAPTNEFDDLEPTMIMGEFPDISFWDGKVKTCVIVDDVEYSNLPRQQVANMNKLFRYGSSHKNITIYCTNQVFFELPSVIRKVSDVFIIWKPRSKTDLKLIANRIGLEYEEFENIFKNICTDYRDSLCIDLKRNTPQKFRKNLWEPINIQEVEGEEE